MIELFESKFWPQILKSIQTELGLMGIIIFIIAAILIYVLPSVDGDMQAVIIIGSLCLLFTIILAIMLHVFIRGNPYPEEVMSIWDEQDFPLSKSERECWLGKWNCRWTYRSASGELHPYINDVIDIESIDVKTGRLKGIGSSAYDNGVTHYKIAGRISNDRTAYIFYSSPPPRTGLSGIAILRRPLVGNLNGWWLGAGRDNGDIGGEVSMSKSQGNNDFELKVYPASESSLTS